VLYPLEILLPDRLNESRDGAAAPMADHSRVTDDLTGSLSFYLPHWDARIPWARAMLRGPILRWPHSSLTQAAWKLCWQPICKMSFGRRISTSSRPKPTLCHLAGPMSSIFMMRCSA
jgi:hypothetical protein